MESRPQRSSPAQSHPLRSVCPSQPRPQDAAELRTGMGRTGMVCSEMGCTGMGHTGMRCTGMGCTGMGRTEMVHNEMGCTGTGHTGMGRPGIGSVSCRLATPLLGTAGNVPTKSPGGAWRAAAALPRAGHPSLPAASTTPRSARGAPRTSNTSHPGPAPPGTPTTPPGWAARGAVPAQPNPLPTHEVCQRGPSRASTLGQAAFRLARAKSRTRRGPGRCCSPEPGWASPGPGSRPRAFGGACGIPAAAPAPAAPGRPQRAGGRRAQASSPRESQPRRVTGPAGKSQEFRKTNKHLVGTLYSPPRSFFFASLWSGFESAFELLSQVSG